MKKTAVKVGKRIRYFRQARGLSQEKLALEAGVNPTFLGHLERGLKSPTVDTLAKITDALGITLSELMYFGEDGDSVGYAARRISAQINNLSPDKAEEIADIVSKIVSML